MHSEYVSIMSKKNFSGKIILKQLPLEAYPFQHGCEVAFYDIFFKPQTPFWPQPIKTITILLFSQVSPKFDYER